MPTDQLHGFVDHESMNGDIIDWKKPGMYLRNNDLPKYGGFSLNGIGLVANNRMDFRQTEVAGSVEIDCCLSRISSCQIRVVEAVKIEEKTVAIKVAGEDLTLMENKQSNNVKEYGNKIKEEKLTPRSKRTADSLKENQKTSALPETNYIHVRPHRG
ncbi:hypothetical protein POTOM_021265 [Populus tomentosa]|uniref:Uncharacterized protein n=1 Tax=Populus tomentosa TaxID=118781 RepID=A0A8X7ZRL3_POPTO|nr:hypothetical protein POTOM_021265 [Populus tomentosa]